MCAIVDTRASRRLLPEMSAVLHTRNGGETLAKRFSHVSTPMTSLDSCASRYTGKERDTESGNDYFGARYYSSSMGRFMSPDWSAKVAPVPYAKLDNPQTLNLYAYMLNNPMGGVDADGHFSCESSACRE